MSLSHRVEWISGADVFVSMGVSIYCGWTKSISHHFQAMVETIVGWCRQENHMSQPQNYQRPLYQRRFIQYWFFAFSFENDRGLTKNDTPEHGLCWTFELELPKSNLCTVPVLKAATCDLEVAASKQKPLRLTRDRRKLRPSSWSCRSVTCALRLW